MQHAQETLATGLRIKVQSHFGGFQSENRASSAVRLQVASVPRSRTNISSRALQKETRSSHLLLDHFTNHSRVIGSEPLVLPRHDRRMTCVVHDNRDRFFVKVVKTDQEHGSIDNTLPIATGNTRAFGRDPAAVHANIATAGSGREPYLLQISLCLPGRTGDALGQTAQVTKRHLQTLGDRAQPESVRTGMSVRA